jgi:proteasome lid subunit RPN8/RPN11
MLQALVSAARRVLDDLGLTGRNGGPPATTALAPAPAPEPPAAYRPLERIVLTDGVSRTLFEEYGEHRDGVRGEEETGWVLLGIRQERQAIALATLPAGMECEAGVAHVRFNSMAQALASRIVRQQDRQLTILGVVHTHPGSLRHPSNGDYQGDRDWVKLLRGRDGVFGIGTADGKDGVNPLVACQPRRHSQCYLGLRFSWYALGERDRNYRTLPVRLTIGPDLARPLHDIWPTIEAHAERLDQLCRRLARVRFEIAPEEKGQALHVIVPLDQPDESIRVILRGSEVEYYLVRKEQWLASDNREPRVDRGVYVMLAALAVQ